MTRAKSGAAVAVLVSALMVPSAASAQQSFDWTGFYAGVHGGYAIGATTSQNIDYSETRFYDNDGDGTDDTIETNTLNLTSLRIEDLHGGAHAGYMHQVDQLVFGGRMGLTLGGFRQGGRFAATFEEVDLAGGGIIDDGWVSLDSVQELKWLTTVTGQLGYTLDNHLLYITAGVAAADFHVRSDVTTGGANPPLGGLPASGSSSELLFGTVIGVGLQTRLSEAISLGAEYTYTQFADSRGDGLFGGTYQNRFHSLRANLNYHF